MTVLDCSGYGRDRGRAHGEQARPLVAETIGRWAAATLGPDADGARTLAYAREFVAGTGLMGTVDRLLPDLGEEIRGIAEGSGLPFEVIAAYNLMDEQWWYDAERRAPSPAGCSVLSRTGRERTLLAQNMDLPTFMAGSQVVLRVDAPGEPEALVLSSAGMVGLTGVNAHGVGVCVNTLLMLRHDCAGLPVAAVVRAALRSSTAADAVATLTSVPHASGQHYAVADRNGVTGLECSAAGCGVVPRPEPTALLHTNHPLVSGDLSAPSWVALEEGGRIDDSRKRLSFLEERAGGTSTPEDVLTLLSEPGTPICVGSFPGQPGETFGSVAYSLGGETTATFCLGRPDRTPWAAVPFSRPDTGAGITRS